jgi:hypothetical protein
MPRIRILLLSACIRLVGAAMALCDRLQFCAHVAKFRLTDAATALYARRSAARDIAAADKSGVLGDEIISLMLIAIATGTLLGYLPDTPEQPAPIQPTALIWASL